MNKNGWMNSQKEIKILQKVVETMKVQLNELQMCKLKLERREDMDQLDGETLLCKTKFWLDL